MQLKDFTIHGQGWFNGEEVEPGGDGVLPVWEKDVGPWVHTKDRSAAAGGEA